MYRGANPLKQIFVALGILALDGPAWSEQGADMIVTLFSARATNKLTRSNQYSEKSSFLLNCLTEMHVMSRSRELLTSVSIASDARSGRAWQAPTPLEKVRGEWSLVTMAWNMKRMFALARAH